MYVCVYVYYICICVYIYYVCVCVYIYVYISNTGGLLNLRKARHLAQALKRIVRHQHWRYDFQEIKVSSSFLTQNQILRTMRFLISHVYTPNILNIESNMNQLAGCRGVLVRSSGALPQDPHVEVALL